MKIKPKIEPLDLGKFIKEKSQLLDIPVRQLEEIIEYSNMCLRFSIAQKGGQKILKDRGPNYYKELRAKSKRNPVKKLSTV